MKLSESIKINIDIQNVGFVSIWHFCSSTSSNFELLSTHTFTHHVNLSSSKDSLDIGVINILELLNKNGSFINSRLQKISSIIANSILQMQLQLNFLEFLRIIIKQISTLLMSH